MQTPDSIVSLVDEGIVDEVLRPLMSGKEAQIYLVRSQGELRVAKVYKEAQQRSFRQRAEYAEGRNVRNTRDQRAMGKRTRHGREKDEAAWRSAEVETIYRLQAAGVRVPVPYHFVDGVLIMELVADADGNPAPRLGDVRLDRVGAQAVFDRLISQVTAMLAAGIVHGDLSDFNVLMGADGPVIIDFPQSVDASSNRNARKLLVRDVDNLHRFLAKWIPGSKAPPYAQEMWQLYERSELAPDTKLTGRFRSSDALALTDDVMALIAEAERDEKRRRDALGIKVTRGRGHVAAVPEVRPASGRPAQAPSSPRGVAQPPAASRGGVPQQHVRRGGPPQVQQARGGHPQAQQAPRGGLPHVQQAPRGGLPHLQQAPRGGLSQSQAPRGGLPQSQAPRGGVPQIHRAREAQPTPRDGTPQSLHREAPAQDPRGDAPRNPRAEGPQDGSSEARRRRRKRRRPTAAAPGE